MRWKECFSKPPQTPVSPSHLLGNDQERGVSVCGSIKNRWLLGAASLLVIGDTGEKLPWEWVAPKIPRSRVGVGYRAKDRDTRGAGYSRTLKSSWDRSKLFSPSFPISACLKDLHLA